jgi:hypothetical protein
MKYAPMGYIDVEALLLLEGFDGCQGRPRAFHEQLVVVAMIRQTLNG